MTLLQDCHIQQGLDTPFWQKWWCHTAPALRRTRGCETDVWDMEHTCHHSEIQAQLPGILMALTSPHSGPKKHKQTAKTAISIHIYNVWTQRAFSLSPCNYPPLRALSHRLFHSRKGKSTQTSPRLVQCNTEIWEQEWSLRVTQASCQTPSITLTLYVAMYFCIKFNKEFLANIPICHGRENKPIQIRQAKYASNAIINLGCFNYDIWSSVNI